MRGQDIEMTEDQRGKGKRNAMTTMAIEEGRMSVKIGPPQAGRRVKRGKWVIEAKEVGAALMKGFPSGGASPLQRRGEGELIMVVTRSVGNVALCKSSCSYGSTGEKTTRMRSGREAQVAALLQTR